MLCNVHVGDKHHVAIKIMSTSFYYSDTELAACEKNAANDYCSSATVPHETKDAIGSLHHGHDQRGFETEGLLLEFVA